MSCIVHIQGFDEKASLLLAGRLLVVFDSASGRWSERLRNLLPKPYYLARMIEIKKLSSSSVSRFILY